MIQSVWKNLTGLQKDSWTSLVWQTSGVTDLEPKIHYQTPMTYIHYMDTSTGTPPSLEEKETLPNCGNKDRNITHVLKHCISTSVATVLKCLKLLYSYVIGVWGWVKHLQICCFVIVFCLYSSFIFLVILLHQVKQNNQKCCLGN